MELFKDTKFDFLGKKWLFIGLSLVLLAAGLVSVIAKGGLQYGIDFRGGAMMYVRFQKQPPVEQIRRSLEGNVPGEITVQDLTQSNDVIIGTELQDEKQLQGVRDKIFSSLASTYGQSGGKLDLNNSGRLVIADRLRDPLLQAGVSISDSDLDAVIDRILARRDQEHSGLLPSFDALNGIEGLTPQFRQVLEQQTYLAPFAIRNVEVVGPKIGADLRNQAVLATLYALGGMLVYIAFRFEWIYGFAAVVAVFHDVLITLGFFSLFDYEISLTIVAALLTLVGYSMNDTIVVFDRMRENLKVMRRESLESLMNLSINQTLSRTVLASGLTFLTVLSLLLFGGPVLHGFAFALTVGILVGTYSSIFIASPIVLFWNDFLESRKRAKVTAAVARK